MRWRVAFGFLVLLAACGRSTPQTASAPPPSSPAVPESAPATAPTAPTNDDEHVDPELRRLLLGADLVILGDVEITACREGCLGHVMVRELVASSIVIDGTIARLDFITAPPAGGMTAGALRSSSSTRTRRSRSSGA